MTWRIRGYVADELIGYGSSSEVWRGRSVRDGTSVALKKIATADPAQARAARAEAALLAALDHPNLLRLHDVVAADGFVVLVLDLADGGSFQELLQARGRLTAGEVVTAVTPIAAALAYAHSAGVVHGDVSAANLLFTPRGLPLLADLGLARVRGDEAGAHGTPAYLDPLVARGHPPHASSDVFSLAAVAFHALSGEPLWVGTTRQQLVRQAAAADYGDLRRRLPRVPDAMVSVLQTALAVEPDLRSTGAEFALDLRHCVPASTLELGAGRERPALRPPAGSGGGRHRPGAPSRPVDDSGRPRFAPPPALAPDRGQLTHGARVALRPAAVAPRCPGRRVTARLTAVLLTVVLLLAVAVGIGWRHRARGGPSALDRRMRSALQQLDAVRQAAFAQADANLLQRVYLPGPLLTQDTSLVRQAIRPGCRWTGVHTTYRDVRASPAGAGRTHVVTSASLAPSTLVCGGASTAVAGAVPTVLWIDVVSVTGGYRIATLQLAS